MKRVPGSQRRWARRRVRKLEREYLRALGLGFRGPKGATCDPAEATRIRMEIQGLRIRYLFRGEPGRPKSLTPERAMSCLAKLVPNPEWVARKEAGTLEPGLRGMMGMLMDELPAEKFTREEAEWILRQHEKGSLRWLADLVVNDSNQIFGQQLVDAARRALTSIEAGHDGQ